MFFIMQVQAAAMPAAKQNKVMKVLTFGDRLHPIRKIREIKAAKQAVRDNWQLLERYERLDKARKNATDAMNNVCKTEKLVNNVPEEYAHFAGLYKDVQTVNLGFATAFAKVCIKEAKKVVAALSEETVKLALKYSAFTIAQKAMYGIGFGIAAVTLYAVLSSNGSGLATLLIGVMGTGLALASLAVGATIKNVGDVRSKYFQAVDIYKNAKEDAARGKGPVDFTES